MIIPVLLFERGTRPVAAVGDRARPATRLHPAPSARTSTSGRGGDRRRYLCRDPPQDRDGQDSDPRLLHRRRPGSGPSPLPRRSLGRRGPRPRNHGKQSLLGFAWPRPLHWGQLLMRPPGQLPGSRRVDSVLSELLATKRTSEVDRGLCPDQRRPHEVSPAFPLGLLAHEQPSRSRVQGGLAADGTRASPEGMQQGCCSTRAARGSWPTPSVR